MSEKGTDILKILELRTMTMYINKYLFIHISERSAVGSIELCCLKMALCVTETCNQM
jgi:hypothetical protein